jgi:hypothetical protein
MSKEKTEIIDTVEDNEPVYFAPKRVSLVADVASVLSWVVLVGFIGDVVMQTISLQLQIKSTGYALVDLLKQSTFIAVLITNLLVPLLTGMVFFVILQAAAVGLNVLLEMDYNSREAKDKAKG